MPRPVVQRCFPPVADPQTRLLVVGSLPGARSLAEGRYYAHPRNQFWQLIGAVVGQDLASLGYEERLDALLRSGVGLWDTVAAATRQGSLDSAIRLRQPSDLATLAGGLPRLKAIGFNGGKAAAIGRRAVGEASGLALIDLPSSSPAYTLPFEAKQKTWMALAEFL